MLKREVIQGSIEGVYAEEERRTLALSYLIRNLFEAKSLDECLDIAIKGLSMLDFFQSQISLLEDGFFVVKRNHMGKKYQFLLEQIAGQKFLGHKIDARTPFVSHLLNSRIVTTLDIEDTVKVELEEIVREFLPREWSASKSLGMVSRVVSVIPGKIDLLIFPLNYRGRVIGAVGISGTSLGHEDFSFLRNLCELFAQAFEKVQTRDELRRSEEKYRQLVENLGEGIWVIDRDAYTTFVNPRMAEMLGYTVDEMQRKHLFSFMDERGVEICKRNLQRRKEGIAEQHDFEFLRKDGTMVYTRLETSPITDDNGNYIGALASVMDITERKKMEERVAYLASIVDNAKVAIATVDMNGIVRSWNKAAEEMLGWTSGEAIGKPMAVLCPNAGEQIEETVKEGFCLDKELEYIKKDGSSLPCSTSTSLMKDKDGNPIGVGGIAIDITERKKAEERIRESEEKYRVLVESAADAIFTLDEAGNFLSANHEAAKALGKTPDDLIGKNMYNLFPKYIADSQMKSVKTVFQTGTPHLGAETLTQTKFGRRWYSTTLIPIRDNNRKIIYVMAISRDITERKKMEEALKRQRDIAVTLSGARDLSETLNRLFDNLLEIAEFDCAGFYLVDEKTGALDMIVRRGLPDGFVKKVGHLDAESPYAKVVMEGKPIYQRTSDFPQAIREDLQSDGILAVAAIPIQYKGEIIGDLNLASHTYGEISAFTRRVLESVGAQIGETIVRARMEETLRKSENKSRTLLENLPQKIFFKDQNSVYITCNENYARDLKIESNEITGKTDYDFYPKRLADKYRTDDKRIMESGKTEDIEEEYIQDGQKVFVHTVKTPVKDDNGNVVGVLGIFWDITEHKKLEEKLRQYSENLEELVQQRTDELLESEKRYSVVVEEASDGVVILQDGKIAFTNKKSPKIVGYSRDELVGLPFEKLLHEKYRQLVKERYERRLRGEKVPATYELELISKTGARVPVEIGSDLIHYQGRPADLVIVRDIKERKQMEEERLKLEKLATIGELATMVGHDLRNPLQSIENATYYLNNELSRHLIPQKAKEMLQVINDSVNYADKILRDLHEFSATKKPALKKTNINTIVKETLQQIEAPKDVQLLTDLGHLPEVKADRDMMKRVFLNLALNGVQAMEKGGRLTVSTRKTKGFVEVSFRDTGIGMSRENIEKIFTPFFTTKAKGMGMGLPICKRFVDAHDGSIEVESEEGKGSTFTVKLPIQQENGGEKA